MKECAIYYVSSVGFFDGIEFGVGAVLGMAIGVALAAGFVYLTR